jgi:hypothetical protein
MQADAADADGRLQNLKQASSESEMILGAVLAELHVTFDRLNQAAWDAFKRAAPPTT